MAAPLALGGTRLDTQLPLAAAALIMLMGVLFTRLDRGARLPWPAWGPLALVGLGLLQLLPLSTELLTSLSPQAADVRQMALADLDAWAGHRHPLSLDPNATWGALFHQVAFVAALVAANNIGKHRRTILVDALVVTGGVLTAIGLVHWVLGVDRIYGLYEATHRVEMRGFFSTFVNNNTLAGLLVLSSCTALGVLSGTNDELRQRVARTFGALAAVGVLLSASRGGQLALLLGLATFALLAHARGPRRIVEGKRATARTVAKAALVAATLLVVGAMFVIPDWRALLDDRAGLDVRLGTWTAAWTQTKAYWLTGSGRGTFALVHPYFQQLTLNGTVTHPENIGLQLLTEWGVPGAVLAIGFGVAGWAAALRVIGRRTDPEHWGLIAGLAAVGVQQVVDFGFEAAGLSIPVAVALGLVVARGGAWWGPLGERSRGTLVALLVVAAGLGALLAWQAPTLLAGRADAAAEQLSAATDDVGAVAKAAAIEHPSDGLVAFNAAQALRAADAPLSEVLRWLNRAMYLTPRDHRPHLIAARALVDAGRPKQAASEYHDALEHAPWWRLAIAKEAALRLRRPADLARAVRGDGPATRSLGNTLLGRQQPALARQVMSHLIDHAEGDAGVDAHQIRARACLATNDVACVSSDAEWLAAHGAEQLAAIYRAALAAQSNDKSAALAALEAGEATGRSDPVFLRAAVQIYARLDEPEGARRALDRLWLQVAARKRPAADHLVMRARIEQQFGDDEAALRALRASLNLHPTLRAARAAGRTALKLGQVGEARRILDEALGRWPNDPQLTALRAKADGAMKHPDHPSRLQ